MPGQTTVSKQVLCVTLSQLRGRTWHHCGQLSKDQTPSALTLPHTLSCCCIMENGLDVGLGGGLHSCSGLATHKLCDLGPLPQPLWVSLIKAIHLWIYGWQHL